MSNERDGNGDRAGRLAAEVLNRRAGCPPADRLQAFHQGELPSAERASVAAHVPECGACRKALEFLTAEPAATQVAAAGDAATTGMAADVATAADGLLDSLAQESTAAPSSHGWLYGLAAAATVALAFALVPQLPPPPPAAPPGFRQPEGEAIRSLLPEDVPLPRDAFQLRWAPGPDDSRYDVLVLRSDLSVLHRARGRDLPRYLVPVEVFEGLPAGAQILWQVKMRLPDGRRERSVTFLATLE